mgnify:CR=1 FL=1
MKKKLCIILGFILVALFSNEKIQAQESKPGILPDTLQVSLLTCGPGTEVYELFGHTALRVKQQRPGGFDYVSMCPALSGGLRKVKPIIV